MWFTLYRISNSSFTLGATIFDEADIAIPYRKVCTYAFFLVIPLSIGLAISRWAPKVSKFLVKILKPMALGLILFIIFFGVYANLYIFQMMTWQVFLCGMGLPWFGFAFGFTIAKLLKRPTEDIIAIAIETGVQNTGMSIFILWFTLDQPAGDMTGVYNSLSSNDYCKEQVFVTSVLVHILMWCVSSTTTFDDCFFFFFSKDEVFFLLS